MIYLLEFYMSRKKIEEITYIRVDTHRIRLTCDIYFHWKQLDTELRTISTRGCNFPCELSENVVCYVLDYYLNKSGGGDCYDYKKGRIIEVKGSSSDKTDDLSSFSPQEEFDDLIFCKVNKDEDCVYIYDTNISSETLKDIQISKTQTVGDQQKEKRRPRFSVYKQIIIPNKIRPLVKFSFRDREIIYL